MTEFEQFAMDHRAHPHCVGCGGCLLDPRPVFMEIFPVWCMACRRTIEANVPAGRRPWEGDGYIGILAENVSEEGKISYLPGTA